MNSLTDLCLEKISGIVNNMPPVIKEMVIEETIDKIKNDAIENLTDILPDLVSEILEDIFNSVKNHGGARINFYRLYPEIPRSIISCAVSIAENSIIICERNNRY